MLDQIDYGTLVEIVDEYIDGRLDNAHEMIGDELEYMMMYIRDILRIRNTLAPLAAADPAIDIRILGE